jgi:hypothetical protein
MEPGGSSRKFNGSSTPPLLRGGSLLPDSRGGSPLSPAAAGRDAARTRRRPAKKEERIVIAVIP